MSFSAQIGAWSKKTVSRIEKIRRGTILKLFSAVILDTPVLTGRLRGNWRVSIGQPLELADERTDESGQIVIAEVMEAVEKSNGDVSVFLTNSLPYAARIEFDGWSHTKAPEGMVRKNVVRFNKLIKIAENEAK